MAAALFGIQGQAIIREMAVGAMHPVILPLSNPNSCSEATPADLLRWTNGLAVVAAGSPFPAVDRTSDGRLSRVDQTNNTYIFPGIALGSIACEAELISDRMFVAAAKASASASPASANPRGNLLPPISRLREVSLEIARAVALEAHEEGLAALTDISELDYRIASKQWTPRYSPYLRDAAS